MVYRPKGKNIFMLRVKDNAGNEGVFSTGTDDKRVAEDVERFVKSMRSHRRWPVLTLIATHQLKLAVAYDAFVAGNLDAVVAAVLEAAADVDLDPLVTTWALRANAKYIRQVRVLIIEGRRFPASRFSRGTVSSFLATLDVSDPTRNRYRAALSVFGKWLVEREVLEHNPVRDVAGFKERDPRMLWMPWTDAERVVAAAPGPYAVLYALMYFAGMELGAARRVTRFDVDLTARTAHAKGSKTRWRNRTVRVEAAGLPAIRAALQRVVGAGPLCEGIGSDWSIRHQHALALTACGLSTVFRIHDARHTYAVNALKQGYKPHVVAHQLGHKDATMVTKVYGRFVPDASDYPTSATDSATSTRKKVKRHA